MSHSTPETPWEAEAEALLDEVFACLEEPLPPQRCLPPVPEILALTSAQPTSGNAVVLAYRPSPPAPMDPVLTAAFVDTPVERDLPWWIWLGLGVVVMLGTWGWQRSWQARPAAQLAASPHGEFIAYLDQALDHIPEKPPAPQPKPTPASVSLPPPPPPVVVKPMPQPPVVPTPVAIVPPSPVVSPTLPPPQPGPRPVLVGLLQMGPQSVAMFQIGDTTQNVSIGETIGSTPWQLREVREREVVLGKGQQQRVLLVGQEVTD